MQTYSPILASDVLANGPASINQNDQTILSCSSGAAFPTTNLQVGMLCYRTDQKKLYQLTDATAQTWVLLLDSSTGGANAYANGLIGGGVAWRVATGQGPAWGAAIPSIASDGGCEIGQYLDFHTASNETTDTAVRLTGATGKLTCSGAFQSNELLVQPSTGAAIVVLNAVTAGQGASTYYQSAGVNKWQSGMNTDASWFLYDSANSRFNITATTSNLVLGGAGNLSLPAGGGATVNNGGLTVNGGNISTGNSVIAGNVQAGGANGFIQLVAGDSAHSGYLAFFAPGGARQGYVGWETAGGPNTYQNDLGNGHAFGGGNVSMPSFTVTSDARLKTDIEPLAGFGELIERVNAYEYTKDGRRQWGVIAQELRELAPLLVREGRNDMLEVDYTGLFVALLAEVRSHRQRLAALEVG